MKSDRVKISLMTVCSIACMAGCMALYHEREEQNMTLQNMVSDFAKEDAAQIGEGQKDMQQSLINPAPAVVTGEQEAALSGLEDEWQLLQIKWDIQKLLKEKEADSTNPEMIYEKYFRLKQGELASIEGIENLDEGGKFPFLNSHFGGVVFGMDESVWVQYRNDISGPIWDYLTPEAIIITDSVPHMGVMGLSREWILPRYRRSFMRQRYRRGLFIMRAGRYFICSMGMNFMTISSAQHRKMAAIRG